MRSLFVVIIIHSTINNWEKGGKHGTKAASVFVAEKATVIGGVAWWRGGVVAWWRGGVVASLVVSLVGVWRAALQVASCLKAEGQLVVTFAPFNDLHEGGLGLVGEAVASKSDRLERRVGCQRFPELGEAGIANFVHTQAELQNGFVFGQQAPDGFGPSWSNAVVAQEDLFDARVLGHGVADDRQQLVAHHHELQIQPLELGLVVCDALDRGSQDGVVNLRAFGRHLGGLPRRRTATATA